MRKADPIRDRKLQCMFRPNVGGKEYPLKKRISRDYGRGLINDHIKDDDRPDHFLHAHARRLRAVYPLSTIAKEKTDATAS